MFYFLPESKAFFKRILFFLLLVMANPRKEGRVSWHHTSLGPAPWEKPPAGAAAYAAQAAAQEEPSLAPSPPSVHDAQVDTNPFSDAFVAGAVASQSAPVLPVGAGYGTPSTNASPQAQTFAPRQESIESSRTSGAFATPKAQPGFRPRASTVPDFLQKGCLRAEVQRLTMGVQGWKIHDTRTKVLIFGIF